MLNSRKSLNWFFSFTLSQNSLEVIHNSYLHCIFLYSNSDIFKCIFHSIKSNFLISFKWGNLLKWFREWNLLSQIWVQFLALLVTSFMIWGMWFKLPKPQFVNNALKMSACSKWSNTGYFFFLESCFSKIDFHSPHPLYLRQSIPSVPII